MTSNNASADGMIRCCCEVPQNAPLVQSVLRVKPILQRLTVRSKTIPSRRRADAGFPGVPQPCHINRRPPMNICAPARSMLVLQQCCRSGTTPPKRSGLPKGEKKKRGPKRAPVGRVSAKESLHRLEGDLTPGWRSGVESRSMMDCSRGLTAAGVGARHGAEKHAM